MLLMAALLKSVVFSRLQVGMEGGANECCSDTSEIPCWSFGFSLVKHILSVWGIVTSLGILVGGCLLAFLSALQGVRTTTWLRHGMGFSIGVSSVFCVMLWVGFMDEGLGSDTEWI